MQHLRFRIFWVSLFAAFYFMGCGSGSNVRNVRRVPDSGVDAAPAPSTMEDASSPPPPVDAAPDVHVAEPPPDARPLPDAAPPPPDAKPGNVTLTAALTGNGGGTITSDVGGVTCPEVCSAEYAHGTLVTLTATPAASSVFEGWTGACASLGTDADAGATCTVPVDAATSVGARFALKRYALTLSTSGNGGGSITSDPPVETCEAGTCPLEHGTAVTLHAVAATGAHFIGWNGDGCSGANPTCAFVMTAPHAVTAVFSLDTFGVTVTKAGTGQGTVTSAPAGINCGATCTGTAFNYGTNVILTAVQAVGSTFGGFTGCDSVVGNACTVKVTAAKNVTATFTLTLVTLTAAKAGTGAGTVTSAPAGISCGADCSEAYGYGTSVKLTATALPGSTFASFTNCPSAAANVCTVPATTARTVTANFTLSTYTLTVAKTGTGTVTSAPVGIPCGATCAKTYAYGAVVKLTAAPGATYKFGSWTNCPAVAANACTVTVNAARTVTANFVVDAPPTVVISSPATGTSFGSTGFDPVSGYYYADLQLVGSATDPEDGALTGASLSWTTDQTVVQPAALGTGGTLNVRLYSECPAGSTHTITLTAKDKAGNVRTASISIFVSTGC